MGIPTVQKARLGAYIIKQLLLGKRRFPLVLMLEPTFRCNLQCNGCGKIAYDTDILNQRLTVEECIDAADACVAPVISIPGGEPLLLPDIHVIVRKLTARKRFVYLCTNALLVEKRIDDFAPSPYLTFNIHLDGLSTQHDAMVCREGVFDRAVDAIRCLISRGFRVTTNSTFFKGETPENAARFFDYLTHLGVEGMTIASAFSYEKATGQNIFLTRPGTMELFNGVFELGRDRSWRFNHSRPYLDFLAGKKNFICTPWGNPTRNVFGWQRPCYLLSDGYAATYKGLMETTDWERYGVGNDPRCTDCMVHCGFEPTAVIETIKNPLKALSFIVS